MRFILIIKATCFSEAGVNGKRELAEAMDAFHARLAEHGVLVASERLTPSASGIRISFPAQQAEAVVQPGPFDQARDLIAAFTVIEVSDLEEAVAWAKQMPDPNGYGDGQIELRQLAGYEASVGAAAETAASPDLPVFAAKLKKDAIFFASLSI
ncbi:YciI family protein [Paenibacillus aurantiacus]|uniref:YciI family protein n=1 Tax=Paenibacillus aurantiacus TaxID=1936118 RepID=A0ABV5KWM6_9BACL